MANDLPHRIRQKSYQLGFDLCGFTSPTEPRHKAYFLNWLENKKFAGMTWLGRNADKRLNPLSLVPGSKSIIVVGASYHHEPAPKRDYKVARYAHGYDYHRWMLEKLESLGVFIKAEIRPDLVWRSFVDTGPVIERDLAAQAGLGWIGKNTCLLNETVGSFVFLGVLISNLDLPQDAPAPDKCLDCQLCVDACPTGALKPYELEPQKCLAYQNIEKRGARDEDVFASLQDHLVGCDVCQEVCPFNFEVAESRQAAWLADFGNFDLGDLKKILQMTTGDYRRKIKHSAMSRIRYPDFLRNVFLVIAAGRRTDLLPDVLEWRAKHPDLDLAEYDYCLNKISEKS